MTVSSLMYDGGTYDFDEFAAMIASFVRDGYVKDVDDELEVSAGSGLGVSVGAGRARIQGYWYENSAALPLTLTDANPTYGRIDRIVLRLVTDTPPRQITAAVLAGTPAASPVAPTLTQTAALYEISLAQVLVGAGVTTIVVGNITDERDDYTVCGQSTSCKTSFDLLLAAAANIDMNGQKITNLPAPSGATDVARKAYYDSVIGSTLGPNKFEIVPVYGAVPSGWLECNGQEVDQASYPELWAAWGTTFGTSAGKVVLPDLRGRMVYGATSTIGTTGGAKTVTLTASEMAQHTHSGCYPGASITIFTTDTGYGSYYGGTFTANGGTEAGSGGAHNNLSPYMALRFMVRGS